MIHIALGCRYEDGQEDYEDRATVLAEEEEEDLNRIKEESRRRRQAILEKYKSQQLQQQNEMKAQSDDAEKGTYSSLFKVIKKLFSFIYDFTCALYCLKVDSAKVIM